MADETVPTYAEILAEARRALLRLVSGAKFVTVNGQQFHYTSERELRNLINWLATKAAEDAGTDGRGAWEAAFRE